MSLLGRSPDASLDASTGAFAPQITGPVAGEDLDAVAPCRIGDDGKVYMSNANADDANAEFDGFTPRAARAGEPITLFGSGARFHYSDGELTPGQTLYIGATGGRLDDAATTGDANGIARAISDSDIRVIRNG